MNPRSNTLSVIRRVLQMEGRQLLRTGILPILLGILFFSAAVALLYGRGVLVSQRATVDSLQQDYQQQFDKLYGQLQADTSTEQGKTDHLTATLPVVVDYRLHRSVYHPPAPFSLMAIGMSDVAGYYYPVSVKSGYVPAEEKVNNPEQLLSGNFDVAFLLIYLLPLIAICLSYNLLSQEKEQGTLALLVIQKGSITGTLLIRLLMRYLILLLGILLITLVGLLLSGTGNGTGTGELLAWVGVAGAYTALWMALIWFIISWNLSASTNLITMLGAWLLLLVVIPASCRLMVNRSFTDNTAGNASLQRAIEWETWDIPKKQLLDSFYAIYPQYRNQQAYDTSNTSSRRAMAYYELTAQRMQRVLNGQEAENRHSMQAVVRSYHYNPAVYTQALLNSIARTDVTDYDHFRQQADQFRTRWKEFFYRLHFNDLPFTAADYKSLPAYTPVYDPASAARWWKGVLYLLLLAAGWLLAGILVLWKRHVRHDLS